MASDETRGEGVNETDKRAAELETAPDKIVARWLTELELADKAEETWREETNKVYELYEGAKQAFNILWSNTETVLPTVYNSTPLPDVRRRFRDEDPVGKYASRVVERALEYSIDPNVYDFDDEIGDIVLDAELAGRGVGRVPYKPVFAPLPPMQQTAPGLPPPPIDPEARDQPADSPVADGYAEGAAPQTEGTPVVKTDAAPGERVVDERVELEHVQWDKFRHGPAKRWKHVPWVSFEHDFTKDMATEAFGTEIADALTYTEVENLDKTSTRDDEIKSQFKTCKVFEIWDKHERRVLFIAECYKEAPCADVDDPLGCEGFLPMPRPVYSIKNSRTLVPRSRYSMYQKKAEQLERISTRVDKIVYALKVRGAYAAKLPEIGEILEGGDNQMIAIANISAVMDAGGLDKMIWIMPIDKLAAVLDQLYKASYQCKQEIYEIIGLSDIMRGSTDPDETLGAQKLKTMTGSVRLENYKRNVQRFARDALRIMADIICSKFTEKTLRTITGVFLPDDQQKQQAQQMLAPPPPPMPGMPPPPQQSPELLEQARKIVETPTWGEVMGVLRSDFLRCTRIDIETDSTVAETINKDMTAITEAVAAVGQIFTAALPIVQSGMMTPDVPKELALALMRRARGGQVVEDALENVQQPNPETPPEAPGEDPAKAVAAEGKIQKLEAALATEKQQRELDKREFDLKLREAQVTLKEKEISKAQQDVQQQQATVADQTSRIFAPAPSNGMAA